MPEPFNVFISHRHEDEAAARQLKNALENLEGVRCFICEHIQGGTRWRDAIHEALKTSHSLVLLYTDPKANWTWCFYEVGLFQDLDLTKNKKPVVVLAGERVDPPSPLSHLQKISSTQAGLDGFLETFFRDSTYSGHANPNLSRDANLRRMLAKAVAEELSKTAKSKIHYIRSVIFYVPAGLDTTAENSASRVLVRAQVQTMIDLFGISEEVATWEAIKANFPDHRDQQWLEEIAETIQAVQADRFPKADYTVFKSPYLAQYFRPVVQRGDHFQDGRVELHMEFVAVNSAGLITPDDRQGKLIKSLVIARRFRYEVIDPFKREIREAQGDSTKGPSICRRLSRIVSNIYAEAAREGVDTTDTFKDVFEDQGDIDRLDRFDSEWLKAKELLQRANDAGDLAAASEFLKVCDPVNAQFMIMATRRWNELLTRQYSTLLARGAAMPAAEGQVVSIGRGP